jgi:hypothetical protein
MPDQTDLPPSIPLTKAQRDLVKGSAPVLAQHGGTITRLFYSNMFKAHPDLLNMFSHSKKVVSLPSYLQNPELKSVRRQDIRRRLLLALLLHMLRISTT